MYRIIRACHKVSISDIIQPYVKVHSYSKMREVAEAYLENVRVEKYSTNRSRLDSLFVFPKDGSLDERAFQWAQTFAAIPGDSCEAYLLELEVNDVEWHDSRYYEDLCFLLGGRRYGMSNINATKESLAEAYWTKNCDMKVIEVEGLIDKGNVVDMIPCLILHNSVELRG